jgi:hypothetical protein
MLIFGVNLATDVNWYLFWYVVFSITFLIVGVQNLNSTGMTAATVMFGIGSALVFIYFGLRWYGKQKDAMPTVWPPIINMCPDYLTYMPNLPGCVDMLGVTSKSGGIQRTLPTEVNSVQLGNTNKVFEYTSQDVAGAKSVSDLKKICDRCQNAGVTWEGIYDGDTCTGISVVTSATATASSDKCSVAGIIGSEVSNLAQSLKDGSIRIT